MPTNSEAEARIRAVVLLLALAYTLGAVACGVVIGLTWGLQIAP